MIETLAAAIKEGTVCVPPCSVPAPLFLEARANRFEVGGGGGSLFFLKHRRGVKGKSVHPFLSAGQLAEAIRRRADAASYAVQGEVPPLLIAGRKFCLRQHVLFVMPGNGAASDSL